MELDIAPDGRVFYIERDGRVQIIKPDTGLTVDRDRPGRLHRQRGRPDRHPARPGLRHQQLGLPVLRPERRRSPQLPVPVHRQRRHHRPGLRGGGARRSPPSATPAATRAAAWSSTAPATSTWPPVTTPTRSSPARSPRSTSGPGRQDYDAQRTSGNTNDLRGKVLRIHPEDDGTYTVPAGNLFPPGTAQTRPEIYAMGFRNPFRIGMDKQTNTLVRGRLRPGRRRGQPEPGPGGHGGVEHREPAGQLRLAVLPRARTTPTTTTRSRPARAGRSSTARRRSTTRPTTPV